MADIVLEKIELGDDESVASSKIYNNDDKLNKEKVGNSDDRLLKKEDYGGDIVPIVIDSANHLLIGWDKVKNIPVITRLLMSLIGKIGSEHLADDVLSRFTELDKLSDTLKFISDDVWLFGIVDAKKQILFGINRTKELFLFGRQIIQDEDSVKFQLLEDNEWLIAVVDSKDQVIFGRRRDGSFYPTDDKINALDKRVEDLENKPMSGNTNLPYLNAPLPRNLCRVDLYDFNIYELNNSKNEVKARIKFNDFNGNYFEKRCILSYQGSSSMAYPKKNFSIDLLNEDGESFAVKWGDWIETDSFHFKANYIDVTHSLNVLAARRVLKAYDVKPYNRNRPYKVAFDKNDSNVNHRFVSGAKCVIDGFPFELYINGEYWGLYTWNMKKDRKNFEMKKDDTSKILMELSGASKIISPIDWTRWEIRSPKMKNMDGGSLKEGQEPESGIVKDTVLNFFNWFASVGVSVVDSFWHVRGQNTNIPLTGNISHSIVYIKNGFWNIQGTQTTFTAEYPEFNIEDWAAHVNIEFFKDFIVLTEYFGAGDLKAKNALLAFYDGIVAPCLYDLDSIYGLYSNGSNFFSNTTTIVQNSNSDLTQPLFALFSHLFKPQLDEHYALLRDKEVLSVESIVKDSGEWMNLIGVEAYKRDQKRWSQIPSNGHDVYLSIGYIEDWLTKRTAFLDNHFNYNK